eukprot:COSAG06_NODE_5339_length_3538_cov_12.466705_1_plen_586_part_00
MRAVRVLLQRQRAGAAMSVGITSLSSVSAGVFSPEAPRPKRGVGLYGEGAKRSPSKPKQHGSPQRQAVNAVFGVGAAAGGPEPGVAAPDVPDVPLGAYQVLERVGVTGTLNFDRDAPAVVGVLAEGDKIVALEGAVSTAGVKRIRISSGWISLADAEGAALLEKLPDTVAAKKWRGGLAAMRQMARAEVEGGTDDSYKGQWRFNAKDLKVVLEVKREEAERQRQEWEQKKAVHQEEVRAKLNTKPLSKKGKQYVSKYANNRQKLLAAKQEREQAGRVALQPSVYGQFRDDGSPRDGSPVRAAAAAPATAAASPATASPHHGGAPRGKDWYEHDPSMRQVNEEIAIANSRPVAFLGRTRGLGIGRGKLSHNVLTHDTRMDRLSPRQQGRGGGHEEGEDLEILEREERKRLRKERRRARSTDMALQRQRDEIARGRGGDGAAIGVQTIPEQGRQARGGQLYPGQQRRVEAPTSLSPPPIPVHHTKNTGARAAAADIATAVRSNPTALSERFNDVESVLASVSVRAKTKQISCRFLLMKKKGCHLPRQARDRRKESSFTHNTPVVFSADTFGAAGGSGSGVHPKHSVG